MSVDVVLKSVTEFNRAMQRAQRAERPNPYWPCGHKRTPDNTKMKCHSRGRPLRPICRQCDVEAKRKMRDERRTERWEAAGICPTCIAVLEELGSDERERRRRR